MRVLVAVVALVVLLVGAGLVAQRFSDGPLAGPIPGGPTIARFSDPAGNVIGLVKSR